MTETSFPTGFAPRTSRADVERGARLAPKFGPDGLLPAVASDAETGEVLMLAYMNAEALARTIETGEAHYYSRSRQRLWRKGESSGQRQKVREIRIDCDQDAVWLRVEQLGGVACHVGYKSCFYRRVDRGHGGTPALATVLDPVEADRGDAD